MNENKNNSIGCTVSNCKYHCANENYCSKNVIKVGMYTRMLLCLIPGVIFTTLIVIFIYLNPSTNPLFRFLYYYHYLAIFFGMLLLTLLTTRRQIKKLFNESVKKSLKGGA